MKRNCIIHDIASDQYFAELNFKLLPIFPKKGAKLFTLEEAFKLTSIYYAGDKSKFNIIEMDEKEFRRFTGMKGGSVSSNAKRIAVTKNIKKRWRMNAQRKREERELLKLSKSTNAENLQEGGNTNVS